MISKRPIQTKEYKFNSTKTIIKNNNNGLGCMGTKAGMTTWFLESGEAIPCTVIAFESGNIITQIKSLEKDGYSAVQVGYKLSKRIKKPEMGHLNKIGGPQ